MANPALQVPNNSYFPPPQYYVDKEFDCVDCGQHETWTAHQQKWYYEVAKGSLYATAVRCRNCRRRRREAQGDPHPIKHIGALMKRVRAAVEPCLVAAGFVLERRSTDGQEGGYWLDYARPGLLLRCLFERRENTLVAEALNDVAEYQIVAEVGLSFSRHGDDLLNCIGEFAESIKTFVRA